MARLSEIFDLQMGKTPARANSDYWVDGTNNWVSISDLSGYEKYVEGTKEQITDKAVQESGIKAVPPNTVIMSFKLSLGKTAITQEAVYTNEAIMAFIPNGCYNISPDYFFYMLSGKEWSKGTNRAVMGVTLNKATLGEIDVTVPTIQEQQYIASTLDKLSNLISLRKQQLAKLDELVKARFVEMFGEPVCNSKKLPTERGENFFKLSNGKFVPESRRFEVGIPAYGGNGISWYTDDAIMKRDTLVVGRVGFQSGNVHYAKGPLWITDNAMYISDYNTKKFDLFFLYSLMEHIDFTRFQDAGDLKKITQKPFMNMEYIMPPMPLQREYVAFAEQTDKSKLTIQQSLDKLEVLKKSLMQEYFG